MHGIFQRLFSAFSVFLLFCASALRFIYLSFYENISKSSAEKIIISFSVLYLICLLGCVAFVKKIKTGNPFEKCTSRSGLYICVLAGAAMFYDFVHQCVNCYNYLYDNSRTELNYIIPMFMSAVSAVLCAFYFLMIGISYVTDKYDFRCFKFYHLIPLIWHLSAVFSALPEYESGIYKAENVLYSAVLIFGLVFFVLFAGCLDGFMKNIKLFCFFGFSYSVSCFVLSVPRICAFVFVNADLKTDFSSVTYLFTGIFAAFLSAAAIEKNKKKDNGIVS